MAVAAALKIEQRAIGKVFPYARNARTHSPEQVDLLATSLREFGFVNPALIDADGVLVAGHGRVLAAKQIGMKTVPVIKLGHLTTEQVRAYRVADNRLQETGGEWNRDLLKLELVELQASGYDLAYTGFEMSYFDEPSGRMGSLAEAFGVPPFSVMNAREGWWQDRKRAWIAIGIQSELGRGQLREEMSHPATTATIDFYAQKRALESERGEKLSTKAARDILAKRGTVTDDRAVNRARRKLSPGGSPRPLDRAKGAT